MQATLVLSLMTILCRYCKDLTSLQEPCLLALAPVCQQQSNPVSMVCRCEFKHAFRPRCILAGVFQGLPPKPSRELRSESSLDKVALWQLTRPLSSSSLGDRLSMSLQALIEGDIDLEGDIDIDHDFAFVDRPPN